MEATLGALSEAFLLAGQHGATQTLAGGTMALRIASNASDFLEAADKQGTPVRIVSGLAEAQLGFLAVAEDPPFAGVERISIIDPGGHSTELMTATRSDNGWNIEFRHSFPVGTLGLKDTILTTETPDFGARMRAVAEIDRVLATEPAPEQPGVAVVLGATGTNLISVREKLLTWQPEKVHGQVLEYEEVSKSVGWMFGMTDAERAAIPGMERGRERTIHVGSLILERFMHRIGVEHVTVSTRGWRYALLDHDLAEVESELNAP